MQDCPQHLDSIKCGVFVMEFAKALINRSDMHPLNVSQCSFRNNAVRELIRTTEAGAEILSGSSVDLLKLYVFILFVFNI